MLINERIPSTFAEFYKAKPDFINQIIHKERWAPFQDEDLEQHILMELLRTRTVEKFDSTIYGSNVNIRHFMGYIKDNARYIVLGEYAKGRTAKRLVNSDTISHNDPLEDGNATTFAECLNDGGSAVRAIHAKAELDGFADYIARKAPKLIPFMLAVRELETTNYRDMARYLNLSFSTASGRMQRFRKLATQWHRR